MQKQQQKTAVQLSLSDNIYYYTTHECKPLKKPILGISCALGNGKIEIQIPGLCVPFSQDTMLKSSCHIYLDDYKAHYYTDQAHMLKDLVDHLQGEIAKAEEDLKKVQQKKFEVDTALLLITNKKESHE
jgi:hypothetical protein